jgi:hypothetical protein
MKFYQLWHERSHISASNLWLRQQILDVARHHLQPPVRHLANLSPRSMICRFEYLD